MGQAQPAATEYVNIVFVPFYRKDQKGIQFENAPGEMKDFYVAIRDLKDDIKADRELVAKLKQKYDNLQTETSQGKIERKEIIFYNAGELPDDPPQRDPRLVFRWNKSTELNKLEKRISQLNNDLKQKEVALEEMEQAYVQAEKDHRYKMEQYFAEQAWIKNVMSQWDKDLTSFPGDSEFYSVKTNQRKISPEMVRYLSGPQGRSTENLVAIIYIVYTEEELDTLLQTPRKTLLIAEMNRNDPNGSCQKVDWLTKLSVRHAHLHLYRVHRDIGEFEQSARKYCHYDSLIDILPDTRTSDDLIEGADKMLALLTLHAK